MSRTMTCFCGVENLAADLEGLVPVIKTHFDSTHPEMGLTTVSIRNYLEAEDRLSPDTERRSMIGPLQLRPVGPETAADIIAFFDTDLFAGNPPWASCYCMYFFLGGGDNSDWGERSWRDNRADQERRIRSGETTGVVAYSEDRVVGWCNATARSAFPGFATGSDDGVASVVCFGIAPPYRGHGVAGALLDGAVSLLASQGFHTAEAYPRRTPREHNYDFTGPLSMFLSRGFDVVSEEPLIVRRSLGEES